MRRGLLISSALLAVTVTIAVSPALSGARTRAHASAGQVCHFSFIHQVTRAAGAKGWEVRFGARISCTQPTRDFELGGNLVSWGKSKLCPECGSGWYVTSALTKPVYEWHGAPARSLTVTGRYFERRRRTHMVWVTFAVQPVGVKLYGFRDTNTKKCQKQSADFYSCDAFSRLFH